MRLPFEMLVEDKPEAICLRRGRNVNSTDPETVSVEFDFAVRVMEKDRLGLIGINHKSETVEYGDRTFDVEFEFADDLGGGTAWNFEEQCGIICIGDRTATAFGFESP